MITFSEKAVEKVNEFAAQMPEAEGKELRIFIQGVGCSGFSYGFTFDEERDGDSVVESGGSRSSSTRTRHPISPDPRSTSSKTREARALSSRTPTHQHRPATAARVAVPAAADLMDEHATRSRSSGWAIRFYDQ